MVVEKGKYIYELLGIDSLEDPFFFFLLNANDEGLFSMSTEDIVARLGEDGEYWVRYMRHRGFEVKLCATPITGSISEDISLIKRVTLEEETLILEIKFEIEAINRILLKETVE